MGETIFVLAKTILLARKANTAFTKWGNKNTTLARYNIQAAKNNVNTASRLNITLT